MFSKLAVPRAALGSTRARALLRESTSPLRLNFAQQKARRNFGIATSSERRVLHNGTVSRWKPLGAVVIGGSTGSSRSISLSFWGKGEKASPAPEEVWATTTTPPIESQPFSNSTHNASISSSSYTHSSSSVHPSSVTSTTDFDFGDAIQEVDYRSIPEDIGYLDAMGLDYGWGPTSVMQWSVEHIHIWGGFGWAASLIITAVLVRNVFLLYPHIRSLQFNQQAMKMKADPRYEQMQKLARTFATDPETLAGKQSAGLMRAALNKDYGIGGPGMLWGLAQVPFSFGLFRLVKGMVDLPIPSMETAGILWFTDLTVADPYFILPAISTLAMFSSIMLSNKYAPISQKRLMKKMVYGVSVVGFVVSLFFSSGINLLTIGYGVAGLVQASIFNIPAIRRRLGLICEVPQEPPLGALAKYQAPRNSSPVGYVDKIKGALAEAKNNIPASMGNFIDQRTDTEKAEQNRKNLTRKIEDKRQTQYRESFEKKYKGGK